MTRPLQAHGLRSKVYSPVLLAIFKRKFVDGAQRIEFTLDEVRDELVAHGVQARNVPDVIYRMKSRTALPEEIQSAGFRVLEITGRGTYAFVRSDSTLIAYPAQVGPVILIEDCTPTPVRRLLYGEARGSFGAIDEQGFLSLLRYNDVFTQFLRVPTYHLKSHVRKSVPGVGQVEVDDVHVAFEGPASEPTSLTIVPVEAKAKDDPVNRAQIVMQIRYARHAFPTCSVRPLTVKLFETGLVLFMEFNVTLEPNDLSVVRHQYFMFGGAGP